LGRRDHDLPLGIVYLVQIMVINALGPALLALLAAVLHQLDFSQHLLFRTCSGVYLLVAAIVAVLSMRREKTLAAESASVLPPRVSRALWFGSLLAHLVQLSNFIGYPADPSVGVFLLGLWMLLVVAAVQFVALLFVSLR
jgi:hypothetical protein